MGVDFVAVQVTMGTVLREICVSDGATQRQSI